MNAPAPIATLTPDGTHCLPAGFYERAIAVHVVGCGGTGSIVVPGLVKIHRTLLALGHPAGLSVTVWDGDAVSESNTVRQNFFESDIGANKADVMVTRLNIAHAAIGLDWQSHAEAFNATTFRRDGRADVVIGCTDTKASRREILSIITGSRDHTYWIDCGNKADLGQVVCGEYRPPSRNEITQPRLPLVSELLPEIVTGEDEAEEPSCSAVQSIMRQGVMTNQVCATWALTWLSESLRHGRIDWCGVFFNLAQGRVASIPIDPAKWAVMGASPSPAKKKKGSTRK